MTRRVPIWRNPAVAFLTDVVLVVAFAAIGRSSHDESLTLAGVLATATPFLAGTAIGWLVVRARRGAWPLEVGPGDAVLIPPGAWHTLRAGPEGARLLCCCAPPYRHEDTFFD